MIRSKELTQKIHDTFLSQSKEPHSSSRPVLYYQNGTYYLAVYSYFYTREDLQNKKMPRPTHYCIANIETGTIEKSYNCKQGRDFSKAPFDVKYDIVMDGKLKGEEADHFFEEAFHILDDVRKRILRGEPREMWERKYKRYLDMLCDQYPDGYSRFYRELSRLGPAERKPPASSDMETNPVKNDPVGANESTVVSNGKGLKNETGNNPAKEPKRAGEEQDRDPDEIDQTVAKEPDKPDPKEVNPIDAPRAIKRMRENQQTDHAKEEAPQKSYSYRDLKWNPVDNLAALPDRYYSIIKRISSQIRFLPCNEKRFRYEYPIVCFMKDMVPGNDPWQFMQLKVLNTRTRKGHFRLSPGESIFTFCSNKAQCAFGTCPYSLAAYYKYIAEKNPKDLLGQRADYSSNKGLIDREGDPGYKMNIPANFLTVTELKEARAFLDAGLFGVSRKESDPNVFIISFVSDSKSRPISVPENGEPEIQHITSYQISRDELENGLSESRKLTLPNGKSVPWPATKLIVTDYLVRSGRYNAYILHADALSKTESSVLISVSDNGEIVKSATR